MDGGLVVSPVGVIDEQATFSTPPQESFSRLVVDLKGVTYIKSAGVQAWIRWTKELGAWAGESTITFRKLPKIMVEQANNVRSFLPDNYEIESFFLPLFCEECDTLKTVLIMVSDHAKVEDGTVVWMLPQEVCHGPMEMDVLGKTYFAVVEQSLLKSAI